MPVPSYKQVNIKSSLKAEVYNQLNTHQFGQVPYVLNIDHLEDQMMALASIEDYFSDKEIPQYPYPIYVISTLENFGGQLKIFRSFQECPQFFRQKVKQLNVKENKILQRIYLKQNKLKNIKEEEFLPHLKEYSSNHTRLYEMRWEELFYQKLKEKLVAYHDQQKK
jgi:hypothetical protein